MVLDPTPHHATQVTWIARVNSSLAVLEKNAFFQRLCGGIHAPLSTSRIVRLSLGAALLLFGFLLLPAWLRENNYYETRNILSLFVVGMTLVTWPVMHRSSYIENSPQTNDSSIYFFDYEMNLSVTQISALTFSIIAAIFSELECAFFSCVLAITLSVPLYQTQRRTSAAIVGVIGAFYLLIQHMVWDFGYRSSAAINALHAPVIPIKSIVLIVSIIAMIPFFKILKFNDTGIGNLRGDFDAPIFGQKVTVAFGSAIFLCAAWGVINFLLSVPNRIYALL